MNYHEFPEGYFGDKHSSIPTPAELDKNLAPFKRFLVQFIKSLPQNAKVLDVGCGSGKTIRVIKAYRPDIKIYGTDVTDTSAWLPKDVEFKKGDAENLQALYAPDTFDGIICQHVIEHLIYPMPLMESFKTVLKHGGKIYLETPNWTRLFTPFAHYFFWNDYTHIRIFSSFSMRKLFMEFNFTKLNIITTPSTTWLTRGKKGKSEAKSVKAVAETKQAPAMKEKSPAESKSLGGRIIARVFNPMIKDLLIITAENVKR